MTEDFSGDPRSTSSARGFIDFGEEWRDDRVVNKGLRKISRADRTSSWEGLWTGVEVFDEFGVVNGVDITIGKGCWWGREVGWDEHLC